MVPSGAVIATVGAPTAVIIAVVGGWRPPLPLSSRWWWVGGAVLLLGPPLPSPSQVVDGWCPGTVVATVGSPAAVTSQVVGGTSHCCRCRCRDDGWAMPPDAIVTVVSSLWWSFWQCLTIMPSGSEQNGVGRGTHLCCLQCPCCGGPAGDGALSLVAGGE